MSCVRSIWSTRRMQSILRDSRHLGRANAHCFISVSPCLAFGHGFCDIAIFSRGRSKNHKLVMQSFEIRRPIITLPVHRQTLDFQFCFCPLTLNRIATIQNWQQAKILNSFVHAYSYTLEYSKRIILDDDIQFNFVSHSQTE